MMDYREFVEELMTEIEIETDLKTEFHEADKETPEDSVWVYLNEDESSYDILRMFAKQSYFEWKQGKETFHTFIQDVKRSKEISDKINPSNKIRQLEDYQKVKGRLFFRLVNIEKYKAELVDSFYKQVGDIALTLYVKISEEYGEFMSCKVPREYVEGWNVDTEEVFMAALKNTALRWPPREYKWVQMIMNPDYEGDDIYSSDYIPTKNELGNCLSTSKKTNGAVAIFYPGVAKLLCSKMGIERMYLSFTSIHEVMLHNAEKVEAEDLEKVLKSTIKEATPERDVLTNHIYCYDANSNQIEMVE